MYIYISNLVDSSSIQIKHNLTCRWLKFMIADLGFLGIITIIMGNIIITKKTTKNSVDLHSQRKLGLAIISSSFEEFNKKGRFFVQKMIKVKNVPSLSLNYCPKKIIKVAPKEMIEMSEEYTRITFHSRLKSETTHLFSDCVLECRPKEFVFTVNCNGDVIGKEAHISDDFGSHSSANVTPLFNTGFLRSCYACNKSLSGYDIYIYRGDASFCSTECRFQEVMVNYKHNETMRKEIEKLGEKKSMNDEDIKGKKVIFLVDEEGLK